jgi:hypothetical protein
MLELTILLKTVNISYMERVVVPDAVDAIVTELRLQCYVYPFN